MSRKNGSIIRLMSILKEKSPDEYAMLCERWNAEKKRQALYVAQYGAIAENLASGHINRK